MSDSEDEINNDENYYTFLNIPKNVRIYKQVRIG